MAKQANTFVAVTTRWTVSIGSIFLAIFIFWLLTYYKPQIAATDSETTQITAMVIETRQTAVHRQFNGYGVAQANSAANIPARINATVTAIPDSISAGNAVTKGQLIAKLDDSDFSSQVKIAEQSIAETQALLKLLDIEKLRLNDRLILEAEDVQLAEQELQRTRDLHERGVGNPQGIDRAKRAVIAAKKAMLNVSEMIDKLSPRRFQLQARIAGLQSSLHLSKLNLERSTIESPIDGVLQFVDIDIGEILAPGQRVARVVNLDVMEVKLHLPAAARAQIVVGDKVVLTATNQNATWQSTIVRIAPEDDVNTRTIAVFVLVNQAAASAKFGQYDPENLMTPGMYLYGTVTCTAIEQRVVVPRRSIREGRVLLVNDGVVHSRPIVIAYSLEGQYPEFIINDDQWAVLEDGSIATGSLLIVNGSSSLLDGDLVRPIVAGGDEVTGGGDSGGGASGGGASGGGDNYKDDQQYKGDRT